MRITPPPTSPVTEAELHAFIDGQLPLGRQAEVAAYLAQRPDEAERLESYRAQKLALRDLFDPVLDEALPARVRQAAQGAQPRTAWYLQRLAAAVLIAVVGAAGGWGLRGLVQPTGSLLAGSAQPLPANGFAQRAAVAHAVYSPEQRRPVEVDAAHEDQLVTWLSKRMGVPMKPPHLQAQGYTLEGGRLLPGGRGPVAQFMYRQTADTGQRLTLYVSNDLGDLGAAQDGPSTPGARSNDTAFRFAQEGKVNVFYWVDGGLGYALSTTADRAELARVSTEVYRQLLTLAR